MIQLLLGLLDLGSDISTYVMVITSWLGLQRLVCESDWNRLNVKLALHLRNMVFYK